MNVRELKNMLTNEVQVEDLILAKVSLKILDGGFQESGVDTPDWILDKLQLIASEINNRNRADIQKQLKQAKARREAIATPDEKRGKLDAQIAELEKKLA